MMLYRVFVSAVFSFLFVVNGFLWLGHQLLRRQKARVESEVIEQQQTIDAGKDSRFLSAVGAMEDAFRKEITTVERYVAATEIDDEFLIQSGSQIVARAYQTGLPDEVLLRVYLPPGKNRLRFAFQDMWNSEVPTPGARLRMPNPLGWENVFDMNLETGVVHEVRFAIRCNGDNAYLHVSSEGYDRKFPLRAFDRPRQSLRSEVIVQHPNIIPGEMRTGRAYFRPVGQAVRMHNEVFQHQFSLAERAQPNASSSLSIRAWVHSEDMPSVPIGIALANFERIVSNYWFDDVHAVPREFSDLFEPYDGSGRVYIKSKYQLD